MWSYIENTRDLIQDLWKRVQTVLSNMEKIQEVSETWQVPLFERRENKPENLIDLENKSERLIKRYDIIRKNGGIIHAMMQVGKVLININTE